MWASPSINATSVPGRTGYHVDGSSAATSLRTGLTVATAMPRRTAASRWDRPMCRVMPPWTTNTFLAGTPPNATRSSVRSAMDDQLDDWAGISLPMRWGSSTLDVPVLYELTDRV